MLRARGCARAGPGLGVAVTWAEQRLAEIARGALRTHTARALHQLDRAKLTCSVVYLADLYDLGEAGLLWRGILEADASLRAEREGRGSNLIGMAQLRHEAIERRRRERA